MRCCLMIEGQEDVSWQQWTALASAVERAGLEGLFRSDHYQSVDERTELGSLDAWATIAALGPLTTRIRLGTLVSPGSFRHPSILAKNAVTADHTSGGRVELGMGAGWHELEHRSYGFPFLDVGTRFDVLAEQLEIVVRQLREERFDFVGDHYRLEGCEARPRPVQEHLPVLVGGSGGPRSTALAAAWADEYNTVFPTPDQVRERRAALDRACEDAGRDPLPLSVMTGCLVGRDEAELTDRARRLHERTGAGTGFDEWLDELRPAWIVGTVEQAGEQLAVLEAAGCERVMLQQQLHDDLDHVGLLGQLG